MARGFRMGAAGVGGVKPKIELTYSNPSTGTATATNNSIVFSQGNVDPLTQGGITIVFSFDCTQPVTITFAGSMRLNGSTQCNQYEIVDNSTNTIVWYGQGSTSRNLVAGSYTVRVKHLVGYSFGSGSNTITVL